MHLSLSIYIAIIIQMKIEKKVFDALLLLCLYFCVFQRLKESCVRNVLLSLGIHVGFDQCFTSQTRVDIG
jgi:hypothetical protein